MTWVKLDDSFPDHPKVVGLSARAFRAYVEGLCYCARHLTDGLVPSRVKLCRGSVTKELQDAGLWVVDEMGNVVIHDYLEWNPSKASVQAKRELDSARKSKRNPDGIREESARKSRRNPLGIRASRPVPKEGSNEPSRQRDEIWDSLEAIFGRVASGTSAHGKRNRAVKDLKLSGATPASIESAHRRFMRYWPTITPTDTALAKHYPQLMNGTVHAPKSPEREAAGEIAEQMKGGLADL